MKTKCFITGAITLTSFAIASVFYSCTKEDAQSINIDDEFGKYTKEVEIFDSEKENSAILLIGSDDESILNMWSSDNFLLIPVKEGENSYDILSANDHNKANEADLEDDDDEEYDQPRSASISTRIISENLQKNVKSVMLQITDPYDADVRGWKYGTHYSKYLGESGRGNKGIVTARIYGHNILHRGYYGVFFLRSKSSTFWETKVSEWTKIKYNEDVSKSANCYVMKATRKYKGSNNSVTIEFEY